jgi:hypothetical protein
VSPATATIRRSAGGDLVISPRRILADGGARFISSFQSGNGHVTRQGCSTEAGSCQPHGWECTEVLQNAVRTTQAKDNMSAEACAPPCPAPVVQIRCRLPVLPARWCCDSAMVRDFTVTTVLDCCFSGGHGPSPCRTGRLSSPFFPRRVSALHHHIP